MQLDKLIKRLNILGMEYRQLNDWSVIYWSNKNTEENGAEAGKFGVVNLHTGEVTPEIYIGVRLNHAHFVVFSTEYDADEEENNVVIVMTINGLITLHGGATFSAQLQDDKLLFGKINYIEGFQDKKDQYVVIRDDGKYKHFSLLEYLDINIPAHHELAFEMLKDKNYNYISVVNLKHQGKDAKDLIVILDKKRSRSVGESLITIDYELNIRR